jgi:hypothetical protein
MKEGTDIYNKQMMIQTALQKARMEQEMHPYDIASKDAYTKELMARVNGTGHYANNPDKDPYKKMQASLMQQSLDRARMLPIADTYLTKYKDAPTDPASNSNYAEFLSKDFNNILEHLSPETRAMIEGSSDPMETLSGLVDSYAPSREAAKLESDAMRDGVGGSRDRGYAARSSDVRATNETRKEIARIMAKAKAAATAANGGKPMTESQYRAWIAQQVAERKATPEILQAADILQTMSNSRGSQEGAAFIPKNGKLVPTNTQQLPSETVKPQQPSSQPAATPSKIPVKVDPAAVAKFNSEWAAAKSGQTVIGPDGNPHKKK